MITKIVPWENPFDKMELSYKRRKIHARRKGETTGNTNLDPRRASRRPYITGLWTQPFDSPFELNDRLSILITAYYITLHGVVFTFFFPEEACHFIPAPPRSAGLCTIGDNAACASSLRRMGLEVGIGQRVEFGSIWAERYRCRGQSDFPS